MRRVAAHPILVQGIHQLLVLGVVGLNGVLPFFALPVFGDLVQNLDFIVGGFKVVLRAFLDLDGDVAIILKVLREPYRREVAPAQLLNNDIPVQKDLAHVYRVIASNLVVRHPFVFT